MAVNVSKEAKSSRHLRYIVCGTQITRMYSDLVGADVENHAGSQGHAY